MIVINPLLDVYKEVRILDPEYFDDLKNYREIIHTEKTLCVLSDELKEHKKEYDNIFECSTVVQCTEKISDPEKFFAKESNFKKVFDFLITQN